ncbi:MAG TPA: surface-adhesin E family protein [Casimicrobiaceae bacterium]|nr:surface-adhesin E family protein [Casimicrobiaceae bacterium]
MRNAKHALPAVVLLLAVSARAELIKVADTGEAAYYLDPKAVAADGDIRRVPVIVDYAKAEPEGVRSRKMAVEVDCASQRLRSVASSVYAEPMAAGKPVDSKEVDSDWLYVAPKTGSHIPPRTPYRFVWEFVCRAVV